VLIHGAAGAVGSIATQLCLANGARVIATASKLDAAYLLSLGVERAIDYKTERFDDHVRDVAAVIDLVGGDTFVRSLRVIRERGLIVTTVGSVEPAQGMPVRAERMVMQKNKADLEVLARLVDEGVVKPRHPRVLPLDAAREAQDLSQSGKTSEKLVLEFA
jgi:NADPH:quinone reductase-like Zn-dependent oxidoreductase